MMNDKLGPIDYGEPWDAETFREDGEQYMTTDRNGRVLFQMRDGPRWKFGPFRTSQEQELIRLRIVRCIDLLWGVDDADIDAALTAGDPSARLLALLDRLMEREANLPFAGDVVDGVRVAAGGPA